MSSFHLFTTHLYQLQLLHRFPDCTTEKAFRLKIKTLPQMLSNKKHLPKGLGNKVYSKETSFFSAVVCQGFEFISDPLCEKCDRHTACCQEKRQYHNC